MLVIELVKKVDFKDVKKELVLSHFNDTTTLSKFERYYQHLREESLLESQPSKIKVNRENFDTSYFIGTDEKDVIEKITSFVPMKTILSSQIDETDLIDLEKPLIIACLLTLLTFNGTCFSEEERQTYINELKQQIDELKSL